MLESMMLADRRQFLDHAEGNGFFQGRSCGHVGCVRVQDSL
jgi:hypothetical protein